MFLDYFKRHICVLKQYKCKQCPFKTKSRQFFESHGHDKQYKCGLCNFSTINKYTLTVHTRNEHTHRTHACKKCDYIAESFGKIVSHNQKHKTYACKECSKQEKTEYYLKHHVQTVHVGSVISCDKCDFKDNSVYKVEKHANMVHNNKV